VLIDTPGRLASGEGASARPSAAIPRDKVALSISTNESMSVAGALQPGDRVDVIASWTSAPDQPMAQAIFADVRVFAVGRWLGDSRARSVGAGAGGSTAAVEAPGTVTLLLDPQQAVTTQYLLQNGGNIALALRRFDQAGELTTEPVTGESLTRRVLSDGSSTSPAPGAAPSP
jgi:Flp pilus assembly protein CpaB